jgi:DNA-binding FrmR family transcriptional regulator
MREAWPPNDAAEAPRRFPPTKEKIEMKGFGATVSPFTRKIRVAAIETGQADLIDWEMIVMTDKPAALADNNPLDKVPVVILDDGRQLYDSPVICEYLDSLHDGPKLLSVRGHVEGILRMLDDDSVYCVDILKQIKAVDGALDKIGDLVLRSHLKDHVVTAHERGDVGDIVDELMEVLKYR